MPKLTAAEELARLHEQHAELTEKVNYLGKQCDFLDRVRRKIGARFTTEWSRRNWIERRIMLLERKVKVLKQCTGVRTGTKRNEADALIAKLTPAQLAALKAILEKGE